MTGGTGFVGRFLGARLLEEGNGIIFRARSMAAYQRATLDFNGCLCNHSIAMDKIHRRQRKGIRHRRRL